MESIRQTKNTADRGINESQTYMTSSQGNMKRGRYIEEQKVHLKPSNQISI
jgi:hypothetical protein